MKQTSSIQHPAKSIQHPVSSIQQPASSIQHPSPGFTLLEIMIAIFIFAVVVTTIFASYRTVFSNADIIDQEITSYEMARNCLNRMLIDLQSIHLALPPDYAPPDFDDPPDPFRIVGEATNVKGSDFPWLRFTSLAHLPLGKSRPGGIVEIVYYIQGTDDAGFVLKRADNPHPFQDFEEKASDPVLCEDVKALTIKYLDQEGEAYDVWDSDDETYGYATPKAVKIKLELETGSDPLLFETMVTLPVIREKLKEGK